MAKCWEILTQQHKNDEQNSGKSRNVAKFPLNTPLMDLVIIHFWITSECWLKPLIRLSEASSLIRSRASLGAVHFEVLAMLSLISCLLSLAVHEKYDNLFHFPEPLKSTFLNFNSVTRVWICWYLNRQIFTVNVLECKLVQQIRIAKWKGHDEVH